MKKHTILILLFIANSLYLFSQPVTQEWVRRWPDSSPVSSAGFSVKQDALGDVYVLADTGNGFGFLKFDPNGNLLFHTTYWPGGSYTSGGGRYFDVSSNGNVFITGGVNINLDNWIYTVKFNSSGILQWGRLFNIDNGDVAEDIKIDGYGNVIIVGGSHIGSTNYALIIKYNTSGDTLWTRHFNDGQNYAIANKVIFDSMNNIYIACDLGVPGECLIMKYNLQGNLLWFQTHTLQPGFTNLGLGVDLDIYGNIYAIGTQARPQAQYDTYLLKLNSNGDTLWSRIYPNYGTGNNSLWGPVVSSDGNSIYYTGSFRDTVGSGYNIVTLKYNSTGELQWAKIYNGGIPNGLNLPSRIKLDKYNNIYVCGTGYYQTTGNDFLTLKYLPDGTLRWFMKYTGFGTNKGDYANDLLVDSNLTVYVTGASQKSINSYDDAVTIKYNQPSGVISNNNELPVIYRLYQNYPNPFNPVTIISYESPRISYIKLSLFNILGREVKTLINGKERPGIHSIAVNMGDMASGVYFYRMTADGNIIDTKKLILIK